MNIFTTNVSPKLCAQALDDKRVIKMALESAQILCTAIHIHGGDTTHLYHATHPHHPCTVWTAHTRGNWNWLYQHFIALCEEYTHRFGKIHKSSELTPYLKSAATCLPDGAQEPFVNCARVAERGLDFTEVKDTHKAYRQFLCAKWDTDAYPPKWTHRQPPQWKHSNFS